MNFITRSQQGEEKLPVTFKIYPHLIPFLQAVQNKDKKHMYPFEALGYFYKTEHDLTKAYYSQIINRTVNLIQYILSYSYNIVLKSSHGAGVNYMVFTDTRMGSISMDFSSANVKPKLAKYSIHTKHRLDLDEVLNNIYNHVKVAHIILSYCNSIVEYAKKKHITNDFIFFNDTTSTYCKVCLDEVNESDYEQVVTFLEAYWTKVNTKTGIDIIAKTASFSDKVYISQIDYIKD